jgi:hypothetical protein
MVGWRQGNSIMISKAIYPRTKSDLIRAMQRMQIDKMEVVEPYGEDRRAEIDTALRELNRGSGDVTVIILRSR